MKELYDTAVKLGISREIIDAVEIPMTRNGPKGRQWHRPNCRKTWRFTQLDRRTFTLLDYDTAKRCDSCQSDPVSARDLQRAVSIAEQARTPDLTATQVAALRQQIQRINLDDEALTDWVRAQEQLIRPTFTLDGMEATYAIYLALLEVGGGADGARLEGWEHVAVFADGHPSRKAAVPARIAEMSAGSPAALALWLEAICHASSQAGQIVGADIDNLPLATLEMDLNIMAQVTNWKHSHEQYSSPVAWLRDEWRSELAEQLAAYQTNVVEVAGEIITRPWTLASGHKPEYGDDSETLNILGETIGWWEHGWRNRWLSIVPASVAAVAGLACQDPDGEWHMSPDEADLMETVLELAGNMPISKAIQVARAIRS